MTEAALRLADDRFAGLVSTLIRLLSEFPERQREALMQTYTPVLQEFPEADRRRVMRHVTEVVYRLPLIRRMRFEKMLQAMQRG